MGSEPRSPIAAGCGLPEVREQMLRSSEETSVSIRAASGSSICHFGTMGSRLGCPSVVDHSPLFYQPVLPVPTSHPHCSPATCTFTTATFCQCGLVCCIIRDAALPACCHNPVPEPCLFAPRSSFPFVLLFLLQKYAVPQRDYNS